MSDEKIKQEEQEKDERTPSFEETTMGDLGPQLPLGIKDATGVYHRGFSMKPWTLKEEKALSKLHEQGEDKVNIVHHVTSVLATICSQIGPYDFEKMKPAERKVHINQMWMGDVFYVYCWIRSQVMSNVVEMSLKCPHCGFVFDFNGDLFTLKVDTAKKEESCEWLFDLKTPITIRQKEVKQLRMGACRWAAMEGMGEQGIDEGTVKAGIIHQSVVEPIGIGRTPLADDELDGLVKGDFEALLAKIDKVALGPEMAVETNCKRCNKGFISPIKWTYKDFFAVSSR